MSLSKIYQIYIYDRQLKKYSNAIYNIEGFYTDIDQALKDTKRASSIEHNQILLSKLTESKSWIVAIAESGNVEMVWR
jgi:hypothetical protein